MRRAALDMVEVVRRYEAGESCRDLAVAYDLHPSTIARRLKSAGATLRPGWVDAAVKTTGRSGPTHHNFKSGRHIKNGYVMVYAPGHPEACGRYAFEHRVIWHDKRGPIPEGWQVHHLNHDRSDNRIENLIALSPSEHSRHHADHLGPGCMTREQLQAAGRRGAAVRWGSRPR